MIVLRSLNSVGNNHSRKYAVASTTSSLAGATPGRQPRRSLVLLLAVQRPGKARRIGGISLTLDKLVPTGDTMERFVKLEDRSEDKEMAPTYEAVARSAARRLSASLDPNLPALTEGALRGFVADRPVMRSFQPEAVELATLVVTMAQLAWTIWHDLAKDRREAGRSGDTTPHRQLLVRRLRLRIGETAELTGSQRDQLIEVVAEETEQAFSGDIHLP
jgi:hypothetical protein